MSETPQAQKDPLIMVAVQGWSSPEVGSRVIATLADDPSVKTMGIVLGRHADRKVQVHVELALRHLPDNWRTAKWLYDVEDADVRAILDAFDYIRLLDGTAPVDFSDEAFERSREHTVSWAVDKYGAAAVTDAQVILHYWFKTKPIAVETHFSPWE